MKRVIVSNVWKKFGIETSEEKSFLEKIVYRLSGRAPQKSFWALKDISFVAKEGDIIGIIGKNGSGKSTLLRIISGIYHHEKGNILVKGEIIPLINLYGGLKMRLTMRDNIFLCGSLLGLANKEIKEKFDSIVKFAELEKFINTKLYQFSNGMLVRLTSSISFHSFTKGGNILLIDDESDMIDKKFKEKCNAQIRELAKKGSIIMLASHDLNTIEKLCNKIIWINEGRIVKTGGKEVVKDYSKSVLPD